jgi:hypothetical protein
VHAHCNAMGSIFLFLRTPFVFPSQAKLHTPCGDCDSCFSTKTSRPSKAKHSHPLRTPRPWGEPSFQLSSEPSPHPLQIDDGADIKVQDIGGETALDRELTFSVSCEAFATTS